MRVGANILLLLTLCVYTPAWAQQVDTIESMKLLTPTVGWAATNMRLYWTTDGGGQWKDITPKLEHKFQAVSSVFFLDPSTGWVLLNCGDQRDPKIDDVCFEFASTIDAGESWSVVHPKILDPVANSSDIEGGLGFSGSAFLDFADSQHGWAILKKSHNVNASFGVTLRTIDGGRTWTQLAKGGIPMAEHFHFVTAKDGWVAGGPNDELYVTRDAGDTWTLVSPHAPPEAKVSGGSAPGYELPVFQNPDDGFLMVGYSDGSNFALILFSSRDVGQTWKFEKVLPSVDDGAITIFRGKWFAASISQHLDKLTLTRLPLSGTASRSVTMSADIQGISMLRRLGGSHPSDEISMADDSHGWILAGRLLRTSDGGATWADITPGNSALKRPTSEPAGHD